MNQNLFNDMPQSEIRARKHINIATDMLCGALANLRHPENAEHNDRIAQYCDNLVDCVVALFDPEQSKGYTKREHDDNMEELNWEASSPKFGDEF